MRRKLCFVLLIILLLSAFSVTFLAEDNAQAGSGSVQDSVPGFGWYRPAEYLWKVTLFVGKTDQVTKQSDLMNEFYRVGTVIIKKTGWNVSSSVKFGTATKVDYYSGTPMAMETSPEIISDSNCPAIPIVCGGNIETVKSYFGSTGTVTSVLTAIAENNGTTKESLLKSKRFTIGGRTKTGWDYRYVAPNGTSNRVPWVIVYEPMVVLHLKDRVTQLAFTATEFALCELNGWYDWDYSNGAGQRVNLLTDYHLPTSVQLEESWFGYPVYAATDGSKRWAYTDTVKGGGWGMRWLPISVVESTKSDSYEFSISRLQISPSTCYENDTVKVTFRTDSWDRYNAYNDVPVQLLYNGEVIYTEYVDYAVYGGKNHTLNLNVGGTVGVNDIKVRVNWPNHSSEINPNNNESATVQVEVKPKIDLTIEAITPNSDYRAGITVITSYRIYNNSSYDITPSHNNTVSFEVYYYENEVKYIIETQTWEQAVIPANETNLVYFKWTVPVSAVGKHLGCKAIVNCEKQIVESDTSNNMILLTVTAMPVSYSQTMDPRYEGIQPSNYKIPAIPSPVAGTATWSLWKYEDGGFIKKNYGVAISAVAPSISPDEDSPSAEYKSGQWRMRSGYGIHINYSPRITAISGYIMPSSSAHTEVQRVEAFFPEFKYTNTVGSFRSLEKNNGVWKFVQNPDADRSERLHFTPLWYPDGNYIVSVTATDVWTPAGMICSVRNSNPIQISDSAYDDWYVGEA